MAKKTKIYRNDNYTTSWIIWLKFYFDSLLFTVVFFLLLVLFTNLPMMVLYVFIPITHIIFQVFNLIFTFFLKAPLVNIVQIDYRHSLLNIRYKYPFSHEKTVSIPFESFSFRLRSIRRFPTLIVIKYQELTLSIRDDIFGLDMLDFGNLHWDIGKISSNKVL